MTGAGFADLACVIADGARVISDFRVMGDHGSCWPGRVSADGVAGAGRDRRWRGPAAAEGHGRGERGAAVCLGAGHRPAWHAAAGAGRGPELGGVASIRLDATVVQAHSDKDLAEANFKGYGHHPLLAYCDNTGGEPLAWMLRKGSAG